MRRLPVVRRLAVLACGVLAALPAAAAAAAPAPQDREALTAYTTTVDQDGAGALAAQGVDLEHVGFDPGDRPQRVVVDLFPSQAAELERQGLELTERSAGTIAPPGTPRRRSARALVSKPDTGGDSPNPFYDVFRSYSEPGGVQDELRRLAADHPDVVKLVTIGTSGRGRPIVALKVTEDARNVPDGTRPSVLYSAVNHAREWIAAEVGRRMPRWFIDNRDRPEVAQLLRDAELWFLPVMNPDGYDYTFTCGIGDGTAANRPCGAAANPATGVVEYRDTQGTVLAPAASQPDEALRAPSNRLWRKTLRDNDGDGVFGGSQDGVDPNRNYPTAWNLDEEGASNNRQSGVYRGPAPLSEPENLAYDRLVRRVGIDAVINYHSAAQLLLYPFGYITDVSSDDNPWFVALTGTDGDAAVDPYISQRSSDLYITNGETTDHVYRQYRAPAWTPELDECETAGGADFCNGGSGFTFPDDEGKVRAVFDKNLDFARNVAATVTDRRRPDRPRNADDDPNGYQVKAAPDIEATRFTASYGREQVLEANVRRVLGPADAEVAVRSGPGGDARRIVLRMEDWAGGERFGDLRGRFYRRVRARLPADLVQPGRTNQAPRPLAVDDVVDVTIRAGGQQQRFSYRVASTGPAGGARRVLVVAAEDYTGVAPNRDPYDDAPRYAGAYAEALRAAGYATEVYDVDAAGIPSALGVLDHFDAVVYETGDDLVPQDLRETVRPGEHRRAVGAARVGAPPATGPDVRYEATTFEGSTHLARYGPRTWQALRDYLNEGGKLVAAGRNLWTPQTSTSTSLTAYSGYTWWQEPVFGFSYPPGQAGDDDRPGTAFLRELDVSNDFGQWFLGVAARRGGPFTTQIDATGARPAAGSGLFAGLPAFAIDTGPGSGDTLDPTEDAAGAPTPVAKVPQRLLTISGLGPAVNQRPLRQERVELDYAGDASPAPVTGGAAISTRDTVAFGFGLEQVGDPAVRQALLARSLAYLLPAAPDTTAPAIAFVRPASEGAQAIPGDPVEVEVEAVDERGDLGEATLSVDGRVVDRRRSFPYQFRWTPAAGDVGSTKTLVATIRDAAGNTSTAERTVSVVASAARIDAPVPTGRASISGVPTVGSVLVCASGGFANAPTALEFAWLRGGVPIPGVAGAAYRAAAADLGRTVACRVTAVNAAGRADSTSEGLVIGAGPAAAGTTRSTPSSGRSTTTQRGSSRTAGRTAARVRVACRLVAGRRAMRCTVRPSTRAQRRVTLRLRGTRRTVARSGRGTVTLTLRSPRRLARSARAVVTVRTAGRARRAIVRAGRSALVRER